MISRIAPVTRDLFDFNEVISISLFS